MKRGRQRRGLWRTVIWIQLLLFGLANLLFYLRVFGISKGTNEANRDHESALSSDASTSRHHRVGDPYFSREPLVDKDCTLHFVDESMAFCYSSKDSAPLKNLGPLMGRRLLEYEHLCSADHLPVVDITKEIRKDRKCLWIRPAVSKELVHKQDIVWPASGISTHPGILVPELYQDVYWLPTQNIGKPPHRFQGRQCLVDHVEKPRSTPFHTRQKFVANMRLSTRHGTVFKFLEELRLCDRVVASDITTLVIADSARIPTFAVKPRKEHMDYLKATNRTAQHWDVEIEPLDRELRRNVSIELARGFPYHLVAPSTHPEQTKESIKTLVIIMGNIRGGEVTWNTFYKHMLDLNKADLALVIGQTQNKTASLFDKAKYIYEFPEYDDWGEAVNLLAKGWQPYILPYANEKWGTWGGVGEKRGSGAVIFMARWYVTKFLTEQRLLDRYDRFVLTRSDHYYGCDHDLSQLGNDYMWVPRGEDYKSGITDRHLVCNRAQILKALDVYPPIVSHPEKYASSQFADLNPEQLLRLRWEQESLWPWVRRFDRVMFTCATDGDKTRWTEKSQNKVKEGVYLKYEYEYEETTCVCKTGHCNFPYTKRKQRVGYPSRTLTEVT